MTAFLVNQQNDDLNQLLDRVELGESITFMRDGAVVGSLVKKPGGARNEKAGDAAARILQRRVGVRLSGDEVKDLISEGRA